MKTLRFLLLIAGFFLAAAPARGDKLVRIAGGGTEANNVPATKAKLLHPFGIDFDRAGNYYLVELTGERVLKVDGKGIFTLAASGWAKPARRGCAVRCLSTCGCQRKSGIHTRSCS